MYVDRIKIEDMDHCLMTIKTPLLPSLILSSFISSLYHTSFFNKKIFVNHTQVIDAGIDYDKYFAFVPYKKTRRLFILNSSH